MHHHLCALHVHRFTMVKKLKTSSVSFFTVDVCRQFVTHFWPQNEVGGVIYHNLYGCAWVAPIPRKQSYNWIKHERLVVYKTYPNQMKYKSIRFFFFFFKIIVLHISMSCLRWVRPGLVGLMLRTKLYSISFFS